MFDYLLGTALMRAIFGDAFDTEAFQRRLGLICFVLLSLLVTGVGYFRSHWLQAERAELAADGATAQGAIVDKTDGWNRNSTHYDFVVEYIAPDQSRHRKSISIDATEYDAKRVGDSVSVRYVRSKPDMFYMAGREPTEAELTLMRYVFFGGLACLAVTLVMLAKMWSGGAGARRTPGSAKPPARPNPPPTTAGARSGGRPAFGKRG